LKEVNHHRKKLSGRRLDYDCKKRKQTKGGSHIPEEEIHMAEEKFEESKSLAEVAMFNLLENDTEQISQLASFIESELNYHRQSADILQTLHEAAQYRVNEAASRPKREHVPRTPMTSNYDKSPMYDNPHPNTFDPMNSSGYNLSPAPPSYNNANSAGGSQPCAKAIYDFDPENEGELGFKEGDIINLVSRIDENWFEGSINGEVGYFPVNYVEVIVDL